MDRIYFSKENFNIIYNILQKKINSSLNVDISKNQNFHNELVNIIKAVYKQRNTFNISSSTSNVEVSRYLSQKVINIGINYFTDSITKKNNNNNSLNRDLQTIDANNLNKVDLRPQSTSSLNNHGVKNTNDKFNEIKNMREYSTNTIPDPVKFKENINVSNDDIQNRYDQISSLRQKEYEQANISSSANTSNFTNTNNIHAQQQRNFDNNPQNKIDIQNYNSNIDNAQDSQLHKLLEQQKFLQQQINNLSNIQNNNEQTKFNPPPQKNIQYFSEDTKELTNILENQFTSLTNDTEEEQNNLQEINDMSPDDNIDLNGIFNSISKDTEVSDQFKTISEDKGNNIEKIVKGGLYDNQINNLGKQSIKTTSELEIIKDKINDTSNNLLETNTKIDKLVEIFNNQDLNKYYETIMNIPKIIAEQKKQPLTIRTHNLIVSSKDRDLSNMDFDKYNFRIVFGAEGDTTKDGTNYSSSGLSNPSVQQVLKNVISIKLKRVVIPKPRDEAYIPEPYLFLSVDEFSSNIISTKTFSDKLFCKVHYDKEYGFDNGRKYIYYKNDDDDYTMFYSSPLAKLDRLTLKLLNSNGESAVKGFNDSDITQITQYDETDDLCVSQSFYNNSFIKDKIYNITRDVDTTVKDIENSIYKISLNNIVSDGIILQSGDKIVNTSNQLEYIFEIKTQEPDPTSHLRPELN